MPAQQDPNSNTVVWPTIEQLRADNQRILDKAADAVKFQRELMTDAWLTHVHDRLLEVRANGLFCTGFTSFCPNGLEQPEVACWILQDVVAHLQGFLPGVTIVGDEGNEVDNVSVTLNWANPVQP
jgi:hypothetical protein